MEQLDRGSYRTKESAFKKFSHTCLGKVVIALGILVILLIIAWLTNPSEKKMKEEMDDNIKQSIWSRDSINADALDIFVSNIQHTFTHFKDSVTADMKVRMARFERENKKTFYDHTFFSTMYITCGFKGITTRCGIGIFGMVIPTEDFNKFIPREGPMTDHEDPRLIQDGGDDEYFGTTHVDIFRWEGE